MLWVGFILVFDLFFVGIYNPYPHGEIVDVSYRGKERLVAWLENAQHPSPATKAKLQEELRLMHRHEDWKGYVALGLLVGLNIAGFYYLLRHEKKNTTA